MDANGDVGDAVEGGWRGAVGLGLEMGLGMGEGSKEGGEESDEYFASASEAGRSSVHSMFLCCSIGILVF